MSDEKKPDEKPPIPNAAEEIKNLKAEMDRKLANVDNTNKQLLATVQQLTQKLTTKAPPPTEKTKTIKDVWYDEPELAEAMLLDKADKRFAEKVAAANAQQLKTQKIMQSLYKDFPELQDTTDPLTVKAIELFDKFSDEEKQHPMAYKLAVKEAAEELELKPKSKRSKEDENDSFSLSQTSAKGGREEGSSTKKGGKLDARTVEFAKKLGLNTDDQKTLDSLKSRIRAPHEWLSYN